MTKVIHPILGVISYESGNLYRDVFKQVRRLPWEYRILVKYHEDRGKRIKADNYTTKGLKTKDESEYKNELTIICFWRQMAEIRLDKQGRII